MTEGKRSVTNGATEGRDTLARARPSYGGDVTVSRVTEDTAGRDSDTRPPEGAGVTITPTPVEVRNEEHRRRLMADPRFAAWAARSV